MRPLTTERVVKEKPAIHGGFYGSIKSTKYTSKLLVKQASDMSIDFLGIGQTRAGTSWIFQCLAEHPEICGSQYKEIHFFDRDRNYKKGVGWYMNHFSYCGNDKITGEYTPNYFTPICAKRIYEHFPKVKLIVCLRSPVERFISSHAYLYERGKVDKDINSFVGFLGERNRRKNLYYDNLLSFLDLFPQDQVLVLVFDDLKNNPKEFIQNVYAFLGADSTFVPPSLYKRKNVASSKTTRFPLISRIFWAVRDCIKELHHRNFLISMLNKSGIHWIAKKVLRLNEVSSQKSHIAKERKEALLQEKKREIKDFYKGDIQRLERFLKRDLSEWYT